MDAKKAAANVDSPPPPLCSICHEDIVLSSGDKYYLPCGHVYHKACIFKWIDTKSTCPMCREEYHIYFKRCTMNIVYDRDADNALQCGAPCTKDSNYCAAHQFFINNINFNHDYARDMLRFQLNEIDEEPAQPGRTPHYVMAKHTINFMQHQDIGILMYNKEHTMRQWGSGGTRR